MSRYPVDAKAVGLVQHDKQKLYMFSILWSDSNNILIYRIYESFKDLSKLLIKKFPLEAGVVNKTERILPILKDAPLLFRSKFSNRYLERLRLLETYSKKLLQIDSKISQCEEVTQFFSPNMQDLTPAFPENSIVIMPSDNDQMQKEVTLPPRSTQPIISETYICIDTFEAKDTKNRSFKVQKNQSIDVLIKDPTGWWLVENEEKRVAWFPAPYLRKLESSNDNNSRNKSFNKGTYYYAEKGYEAQYKDEISLAVGIVVEVMEKSENGWWLICLPSGNFPTSFRFLCTWLQRFYGFAPTITNVFITLDLFTNSPGDPYHCLAPYNGRFGYVPSMFLKPYKNPHQKLQVTLDHHLSGSSPNLSKVVWNLDTGSNPQHRIKDVGVHKGKLEWMKSISLNDLNDLSDSPDPIFAQSSRQRTVYVEWEKQDTEELASPSIIGEPRSVRTKVFLHDWKDNVEEKERKDSGFDERLSPRTSVSSASADPSPPTVPQRPTLQEIRSRCTTITRKAAHQGSF